MTAAEIAVRSATHRLSRSYPLDELSSRLHQRGNGLRAGPRDTVKITRSLMRTDRWVAEKPRPQDHSNGWGRRAMCR